MNSKQLIVLLSCLFLSDALWADKRKQGPHQRGPLLKEHEEPGIKKRPREEKVRSSLEPDEIEATLNEVYQEVYYMNFGRKATSPTN